MLDSTRARAGHGENVHEHVLSTHLASSNPSMPHARLHLSPISIFDIPKISPHLPISHSTSLSLYLHAVFPPHTTFSTTTISHQHDAVSPRPPSLTPPSFWLFRLRNPWRPRA
uniref:Uncharacterized protein n=1 Tax=Cucumis sativus TaxID=3659 RepID=A0A0A0LTC5_CUCSA